MTSVLSASHVETVGSAFNGRAVSVPGGPILTEGGVPNVIRSGAPTTGIDDASVYLFNGVTLNPATGTGARDVGVGGSLVGDGDAHARITFSIVGSGRTTIEIGTLFENGDAVVVYDPPNPTRDTLEETNIATFELRVRGPVDAIPEPTGALLFGAALTTIATAQRRRR